MAQFVFTYNVRRTASYAIEADDIYKAIEIMDDIEGNTDFWYDLSVDLNEGPDEPTRCVRPLYPHESPFARVLNKED